MKIKRLSFLLALVMILSAFAGTFTISAEGEETAVNAWEVNGATYATFQEAIDAAVAGDTIYLVADYTQTGDVVIKKDLTVDFNPRYFSGTFSFMRPSGVRRFTTSRL